MPEDSPRARAKAKRDKSKRDKEKKQEKDPPPAVGGKGASLLSMLKPKPKQSSRSKERRQPSAESSSNNIQQITEIHATNQRADAVQRPQFEQMSDDDESPRFEVIIPPKQNLDDFPRDGVRANFSRSGSFSPVKRNNNARSYEDRFGVHGLGSPRGRFSPTTHNNPNTRRETLPRQHSSSSTLRRHDIDVPRRSASFISPDDYPDEVLKS